MTLKLVRTGPYNNDNNFGFTLFNNSLYYSVPGGKWIYRYPLIYYKPVYMKTLDYASYGITYDGKFFYLVDYVNCYVKKYDQSFTLVKTYTVGLATFNRPVCILSVNGFFYVGFYITQATTYYIIKYNSNFIPIEYIHPGIANPNSMAYDGRFFYFAFNINQTIYKYDSRPKLVSTSSSLGYQPTGLGWDGKFLYIWDTTNKFLKKYSVNQIFYN